MAPEVADRYEALVAAGRLEAGAASIVSVEPHGSRARVFLRKPGAHELESVEVDRVINCAGAGCDLRREAPPVLAGLLGAGSARPDELGLGLDVDDHGALLDREGNALGAALRDRQPAQGRRVGGDRDHRDPRPLRRRRPQDRPHRRNRGDPTADRAAPRRRRPDR